MNLTQLYELLAYALPVAYVVLGVAIFAYLRSSRGILVVGIVGSLLGIVVPETRGHISWGEGVDPWTVTQHHWGQTAFHVFVWAGTGAFLSVFLVAVVRCPRRPNKPPATRTVPAAIEASLQPRSAGRQPP